jgi:hypothetical protein
MVTKAQNFSARPQFMDEPTQPAEPSRARWFSHYIAWGFVAAVVYVLSSGPALLMSISGRLKEKVWIVYWPIDRAYFQTPLHKPVGIYWHLWCPKLFDSKGNLPNWIE